MSTPTTESLYQPRFPAMCCYIYTYIISATHTAAADISQQQRFCGLSGWYVCVFFFFLEISLGSPSLLCAAAYLTALLSAVGCMKESRCAISAICSASAMLSAHVRYSVYVGTQNVLRYLPCRIMMMMCHVKKKTAGNHLHSRLKTLG